MQAEKKIKSDFHIYRESFQPEVSQYLRGDSLDHASKEVQVDQHIQQLFPSIMAQHPAQINLFPSSHPKPISKPLRIGCVLSGGQAAGGHNVIVGLFDQIKKISPNSQLFGFLNGPIGIYTGHYQELDQATISYFKNRGGFDMIKSGRNKIETQEQFSKSKEHCEALGLDGLVVIGGDDSNTNACLLAEYFLKEGSSCKVIGCPKTIDGDLKNDMVEVSFGYDTACKTYAEQIGNLMMDTLSTKKYYHFVRLMGRSASHIALECALLTRPTYTIIGEEVKQNNMSLFQIVQDIVRVIKARADQHKQYGVILVPEGLIEFIPEMNSLIQEINTILSSPLDPALPVYQAVSAQLSPSSQSLLDFLPATISQQLLLDRDPHGNVQVAKIETEKLLISLVQNMLSKEQHDSLKFSPQSHYLGYEGRCAFPSRFDCNYCYNLGLNAAVLIQKGFTGLMSCVTNLKNDVDKWVPCGYPLVSMMHVERRKGKDVPVIEKALTQLDGPLFQYYKSQREEWAMNDLWRQLGPIQYEFKSQTDVPFLVHMRPQEFDSTQPSHAYVTLYQDNLSCLAQDRARHKVNLSSTLTTNKYKVVMGHQVTNQEHSALKFLHTGPQQLAEIVPRKEIDPPLPKKPLKIGVCFNARQSPGGNNVIDGLLDFLEAQGHGQLIGFLNGTKGLFKGDHLVITQDNYKWFRNQGGYHFLGRSADKLRSQSEQEQTRQTCESLQLDGLVLIGASHTFTDAAYLSNYFLEHNVSTKVITVPCTIDNNLGNHMLEQSVGFDTASKVYSQLIGNIMIDSASAVKYWYFMRLMGRKPSHLLLETALQSCPNTCVISEEVAQKGQSLQAVVNNIADIVQLRASQGKNFGCVLIPEGIISYIPLFQHLLEELNAFIKQRENEAERLLEKPFAKDNLSPWAAESFHSLPDFTQKQLILEREVHGEVQLSQVESERLFAHLVGEELKKRKHQGLYKQSYSAICHYFGYQGRSAMPSQFDCELATSYGFTAGVLIQHGLTGYSVTARGLSSNDHHQWHLGGIPLLNFIKVRDCASYGPNASIVPSHDVQLTSNSFLKLKEQREAWQLVDYYACSGPTQFKGPKATLRTLTIQLDHKNYTHQLEQVMQLTKRIEQSAKFGVHEDLLNVIIRNLENLQDTLSIVEKKFI